MDDQSVDPAALQRLREARPEKLDEAAGVFDGMVDRMTRCAAEFEREVISRIDSPEPVERALGAAHAACLSQELVGEIEHLRAAGSAVQAALPGFQTADAMGALVRTWEAKLRSMAAEMQAASEELLRPSDESSGEGPSQG